MIQIDMDMPKSCDECMFVRKYNDRRYCNIPVGMMRGEYVGSYIARRPSDCPLSEPEPYKGGENE